jgi:diacylglycerol kinase family enzyme
VDRYQAAGELRAVVAAGGDGTVAEVANRLPADVPIAVFPLGTANLLAGHLGVDGHAPSFAQMVRAGHTQHLDAGRANGRIFLLMAGCGFDADVVRRVHRRRGSGITYWHYARPIIESIRSYRYPDLRVYCERDGKRESEQAIAARWAFVFNLPCYAGGLQLAPEAVGDDGLLVRRARSIGDYHTAMATRVRIESDEAVPYQLDGDPGGMLPLDIEVLPRRLTVVRPLATE